MAAQLTRQSKHKGRPTHACLLKAAGQALGQHAAAWSIVQFEQEGVTGRVVTPCAGGCGTRLGCGGSSSISSFDWSSAPAACDGSGMFDSGQAKSTQCLQTMARALHAQHHAQPQP